VLYGEEKLGWVGYMQHINMWDATHTQSGKTNIESGFVFACPDNLCMASCNKSDYHLPFYHLLLEQAITLAQIRTPVSPSSRPVCFRDILMVEHEQCLLANNSVANNHEYYYESIHSAWKWWCKSLGLLGLYSGVMLLLQIRAMGWNVAAVVNTALTDDVSVGTASAPPTTTQSVAPTQWHIPTSAHSIWSPARSAETSTRTTAVPAGTTLWDLARKVRTSTLAIIYWLRRSSQTYTHTNIQKRNKQKRQH